MHDVAIVGVAAEDVGNDFAKGLWVEPFVDVLNSSVDVLLSSRDATLHVAVVGHCFTFRSRWSRNRLTMSRYDSDIWN